MIGTKKGENIELYYFSSRLRNDIYEEEDRNSTWRKIVFRYSWQNSEEGMSFEIWFDLTMQFFPLWILLHFQIFSFTLSLHLYKATATVCCLGSNSSPAWLMVMVTGGQWLWWMMMMMVMVDRGQWWLFRKGSPAQSSHRLVGRNLLSQRKTDWSSSENIFFLPLFFWFQIWLHWVLSIFRMASIKVNKIFTNLDLFSADNAAGPRLGDWACLRKKSVVFLFGGRGESSRKDGDWTKNTASQVPLFFLNSNNCSSEIERSNIFLRSFLLDIRNSLMTTPPFPINTKRKTHQARTGRVAAAWFPSRKLFS